MAEFCTKCFTALNEDGQCPACGHRNTPAVVVNEEPIAVPVPTPAPVYKFCMKCGNTLDENGLCPVCDAPAPAPTVQFCMKCGAQLDENGLCPVCDAPAPTPTVQFCMKCGAQLDENGLCPVCDAPAPAPVAKFCMKCGNTLDENGLCLVCDAPAPTPTVQFCMKCGAQLDENGLCPVCDAPAPAPTVQFCMKCGAQLDENGLCPVCDAPAPAPTVQFCMKCGAQLDENGLCPVCDAPAPVMDEAEVAQPANAPAQVPVAEEIASKKNNKAWSVIATVLLSICLFITTLASVGIIAVRSTVSEGGAYNLTEELDVATLLQSSGVADGDNFDELYMRLERDYGVKLDNDELADLIEESTIPEYLSKKAGNFSDDFFAGDAELVITKSELTELIEDNLDLINDAQIEGYEGDLVRPEDCATIADWMFNGDKLVLMTSDDLSDSAPALYQVATIGLSWLSLGFFLLLSALIGFVMCRNSLSQAAIGGGVVFILIGGVTALAAAVVAWIPSLWTSIAGDGLIGSLLGSLLTVNALIFTILLVIGILLLVARAVVKHTLKKRA